MHPCSRENGDEEVITVDEEVITALEKVITVNLLIFDMSQLGIDDSWELTCHNLPVQLVKRGMHTAREC